MENFPELSNFLVVPSVTQTSSHSIIRKTPHLLLFMLLSLFSGKKKVKFGKVQTAGKKLILNFSHTFYFTFLQLLYFFHMILLRLDLIYTFHAVSARILGIGDRCTAHTGNVMLGGGSLQGEVAAVVRCRGEGHPPIT